eukprot:135699_1
MNSNNKNVSKSSLQNTCKQDKSVDITTQKSKRKTPTIWRGIEQETFKNGLELYGRDWNKISQMDGIINKSIHSIKAYAMRYFALLWRDNIPLPSKVKETGNGYTLNGSPLDPNSPIVQSILRKNNEIKSMMKSVKSVKSVKKNKRKRVSNKNDKKMKHDFKLHSYSWINDKNEPKRPNIFTDKNKGQNINVPRKHRKFGVSYSYPMIQEGFAPSSGAIKHLAPLFIRPPNLKQLNHNFMDVTFSMWFHKIWFTKYEKLKTIISDKNVNSATASPFDVLSTKIHKQNDKQIKSIKIPKVSIVYNNEYKQENNECKYDKLNSNYISQMYHSMAMPDINEELIKNRIFNVVYFNLDKKPTIPINRMIKKWGLVNGDVRRQIFEQYHGQYMTMNDLCDILNKQNKNKTPKSGIFFVHFKYNPFIGI